MSDLITITRKQWERDIVEAKAEALRSVYEELHDHFKRLTEWESSEVSDVILARANEYDPQ